MVQTSQKHQLSIISFGTLLKRLTPIALRWNLSKLNCRSKTFRVGIFALRTFLSFFFC